MPWACGMQERPQFTGMGASSAAGDWQEAGKWSQMLAGILQVLDTDGEHHCAWHSTEQLTGLELKYILKYYQFHRQTVEIGGFRESPKFPQKGVVK